MHQAALLLAACSSAKCNLELLPEAIWTRSQPQLRSKVNIIPGRSNARLLMPPSRLCEAHPQRCMIGGRGPTLLIRP